MAIKVDRPADFFGDGIVAYVAKSREEVTKLREGFAAAGLAVELPEAAVEAWFASGKDRLEIRVRPDDFRAASDVVDELFPREELILPDDEPEEEAPPAEGAAVAPASGGGPSGPTLDDVTTADAPTQGRGPRLSQEKLKGSALKVMFISAIAAPFPVVGLILGLFGLYGAVWCLRASDSVVGGEQVRPRAIAAIVVAVVALLVNAAASLYVAHQQGWL
jgi:hypothetical protein